jgi:NADH-quinone oxidoreductase subunit M
MKMEPLTLSPRSRVPVAFAANSTFAEMNLKEGVLIMVFIGIIGFTGLYPKPMLDRIEPSVVKLVEHVEKNSDYKAPVGAKPVEVSGQSEGDK